MNTQVLRRWRCLCEAQGKVLLKLLRADQDSRDGLTSFWNLLKNASGTSSVRGGIKFSAIRKAWHNLIETWK